MFKTLAAATIASTLVLAAPSSQALAACRPLLLGPQVASHFLAPGKVRAIAAWRLRARLTYGPAFRHWFKARNKHFHTVYIAGSYLHWRIRAHARPCN